MKISYIYLLLTMNYVTTVVAYYRKCYEEFSICLITNTDDPPCGSKFRLYQQSAYNWCTEKSSSLAIITNASVQSAIEAFLNDPSAKLDSDVITNSYQLPLNYWEWINRRISANNPISERSDYRYAYLLVSAGRLVTLNASTPTAKRNFICSYLSHNSSCPNDTHQLNNSCYKLHNSEAANWFDARNLCLHEGYDLATFADIDFSSNSGWLSNGEYWAGLRSEIWNWLLDQRFVEIKYMNWDTYGPFARGGDCLCLIANTGKWKDCDCSQRHRYICIQAPTTTRITTSTTKADGQSTLITILDDSYKQPDDSEDSGKKNNDSQRLIIWIPLAILIILIAVVVAWIAVKKYCKRNRNMLGGGSTKSQTLQPSSFFVDAYATLNPETSTKNRTYDQLQLYETIEDNETHNNKPMPDEGSSKNKTNQSASSVDEYATLNPETSTDNRTYAQLQLYETIGDETK